MSRPRTLIVAMPVIALTAAACTATPPPPAGPVAGPSVTPRIVTLRPTERSIRTLPPEAASSVVVNTVPAEPWDDEPAEPLVAGPVIVPVGAPVTAPVENEAQPLAPNPLPTPSAPPTGRRTDGPVRIQDAQPSDAELVPPVTVTPVRPDPTPGQVASHPPTPQAGTRVERTGDSLPTATARGPEQS